MRKCILSESKMRPNRMSILFDQSDGGVKQREQRCLQITTEEIPNLWHEQFGPISHRGMKTLQRKGMVRRVPNFDIQTYTCS